MIGFLLLPRGFRSDVASDEPEVERRYSGIRFGVKSSHTERGRRVRAVGNTVGPLRLPRCSNSRLRFRLGGLMTGLLNTRSAAASPGNLPGVITPQYRELYIAK